MTGYDIFSIVYMIASLVMNAIQLVYVIRNRNK